MDIVHNVGGDGVHFSLGAAVYVAIKPLVKIYLSLGLGYMMAKFDILTPAGQRSIGQMILNIFTPCLIFYNIVSQIKDTNIELLGVIVLTSFMFYMIGLSFGFILRLVSPIPRGWYGGLLLASMVNNVSDLPVAYVQTLGKAKQIPASQANKGTAYVVLFSIMFTILTFNCGGTRLVAWDFRREDPKRNEPTVPLLVALYKKWFKKGPKNGQVADKSLFPSAQKGISEKQVNTHDLVYNDSTEAAELGLPIAALTISHDAAEMDSARDHPHLHYFNMHHHRRLIANGETESYYCSSISRSDEDDIDIVVSNNDQVDPDTASHTTTVHSVKQVHQVLRRKWRRFRQKNRATNVIAHFIEDIRMPQMIALIVSITIAMIPWVKRVFTNDPNQYISGFHDPPDGNPPLDFLMDFISFMSGAQVPLGLMMLGGTMARLKIGKLVPGFWCTATCMAIFKLCILPIIACAWISRLQRDHWIDKNDYLVPVVIGVSSGTPTATMQIYLTLAHTSADADPMELNCLAVCLITQYIILPVPMTILVTYILKNFV